MEGKDINTATTRGSEAVDVCRVQPRTEYLKPSVGPLGAEVTGVSPEGIHGPSIDPRPETGAEGRHQQETGNIPTGYLSQLQSSIKLGKRLREDYDKAIGEKEEVIRQKDAKIKSLCLVNEDLRKKNEVLCGEKTVLESEVKRLRIENASLEKKEQLKSEAGKMDDQLLQALDDPRTDFTFASGNHQ